MKLTGIIEDVFRGVTIFRGYATLRTLAKLSASTSYQRDKDPDRITAITDYIAGSSYVFFPELILGWQLDNHDAIRKIKEEENTSSISLDNGIKIKKAKFRFKSLVSGEEPKTKVVTIEIPDTLNVTIFNRIDGNHRLSAIDKIREETGAYDNEICNQIVPFCLIIQNESDVAKKFESAYFYLINSKAKSLTTEDNLRSILNSSVFSSIEIASLFKLEDESLVKIRCILEFVKTHDEVLDFVSKLYNDAIYSLSMKIVTELKNDVSEIKRALISVNLDYATDRIKIKNRSVFFSALDIYLNHKNEYERFVRWINYNKLGEIEQIPSNKLVELYLKTHVKTVYKVFVAMPYVSYKRVNDFNKLFRDVIEIEIPKEVNVELELIPIMRFKGRTQRIDQRVIQSIKDCQIFIADITGLNENVIFEIGVAQGLDVPCLLIKANPDSDIRGIFDEAGLDVNKEVPFDMDKLQYVPYSLTGYYNDIKSIVKNNIIEILKVNYEVEIIKE